MFNSSVVLNVHNSSTFIDGRIEKDIYKELKRELGYMPENAIWAVEKHREKGKDKNGNYLPGQEWRDEWDGSITTICYNKSKCKCNVKKSGMHFPTGILSSALKVFKKYNIEYKVIDNRVKTGTSNILNINPDFKFRDYQEDVINKTSNCDRGLIKVATGGGKTLISSGIIIDKSVFPTIFYVPSVDLLKQSKDEFEKTIRKMGNKVKVGQVGGGEKDIRDITVMTIQTAVKSLGGVWVKYDEEDATKDDTDIEDSREQIKNLIQNSRLILGDEVQHWAAETCQIIADNSFAAQYRYGLSATPYRDLGDDILIDACFGKTIVDINASKLIEKNYLVQPTIYCIPMPKPSGMTRYSYAKIYKESIVEHKKRNETIAFMAKKLYEEGRNILILCKQINHGNLLEKMIDGSTFIHGSSSKKKRDEHLDKMRTGEARITISSVIFDEGIDCRPLDTLILAGSGKSSTRALQRIGRILRPYEGKKDAYVIDFKDQSKYLIEHYRQRLKIYKTEKLFKIKELQI